MQPGDDLKALGGDAEARDTIDIAAAHLAARAVQRRVIAMTAVSALIGVAVLASAIVSAGLPMENLAGR